MQNTESCCTKDTQSKVLFLDFNVRNLKLVAVVFCFLSIFRALCFALCFHVLQVFLLALAFFFFLERSIVPSSEFSIHVLTSGPEKSQTPPPPSLCLSELLLSAQQT